MKSPEICAELGGYLAGKVPPSLGDVHHPDLTVTVEVRTMRLMSGGTAARRWRHAHWIGGQRNAADLRRHRLPLWPSI